MTVVGGERKNGNTKTAGWRRDESGRKKEFVESIRYRAVQVAMMGGEITREK
jgi:hypothetical protein